MKSKLIIIDVDALLGIKHSLKKECLDFSYEECYEAISPVFDKLQETDWVISLWTTRPKNQSFRIIELLKHAGLWDKAQLLSGTMLLLNTRDSHHGDGGSLANIKLGLFEKVYGNIIDNGIVVAVESDLSEARILDSYLRGRLSIYMAPKIWMSMLAMDSGELDTLLLRGGDVLGKDSERDLAG